MIAALARHARKLPSHAIVFIGDLSGACGYAKGTPSTTDIQVLIIAAHLLIKNRPQMVGRVGVVERQSGRPLQLPYF